MKAEKENIKPEGRVAGRGRHYLLKYTLSLVFGWVFVGVLLGLIGLVVDHLFNGGSGMRYAASMGGVYAATIASLLVFGIAYLKFTIKTGKNVELTEKGEKYTKIMLTLFALGLAISAAVYFVALLTPLVSCVFGFSKMVWKTDGPVVVTSAASIVVIGLVLAYHLKMHKFLTKWIYVGIIGGVTLVLLILFTVFPARAIRDSASDQRAIDDLSMIESKISRYVDKKNALPKSLDVLKLDELNNDLERFSYKKKNGSSYRLEYELCFDGFRVDTRDKDIATPRPAGSVIEEMMPIVDEDFDPIYSGGYSNFYSHGEGKYCFKLFVYSGSFYDDEEYDYGYEDDYESKEDYDFDSLFN